MKEDYREDLVRVGNMRSLVEDVRLRMEDGRDGGRWEISVEALMATTGGKMGS